MRLGILSDIHADLEGLEKALDLLKEMQVSQIICAGDLVDRGSEPNEVIARIQAEKIPCVRGNHDALARTTQAHCLKYPERFPNYVPLTEASFDYLDNLPLLHKLEWQGKRLCIAHGTPSNYDEYVYHLSPPPLYQRVLLESEADMLILGHTHRPMAIQTNKGWIFNGGSTYSNYPITLETLDTRHRSCAVLDLAERYFEVYDLDSGETIEIARRNLIEQG